MRKILILLIAMALGVAGSGYAQEARSQGSVFLKTNIPAWAALDANLAVEFGLGKHMSVSVPVYYSPFNWFGTQNRFRVIGTQPELRGWLRDDFSGPFAAVHGTVGFYNVALKGWDYRIQDRGGKTPAYGAGLNLGWRFRLDRARADRLGLEISVGGGWLHLDYDRFYNVENGRYDSSEVRDYIGIDHVSVALTYRLGR